MYQVSVTGGLTCHSGSVLIDTKVKCSLENHVEGQGRDEEETLKLDMLTYKHNYNTLEATWIVILRLSLDA